MLNNWKIIEDNKERLVITKGKYKIVRQYISPNPRAWEGDIVVNVYENDEFLTSRDNLTQALNAIQE